MEKYKTKKDFNKLDLMNKIKELMDEWGDIYKRDRKVTRENFERVINGAREIVSYLKKLEIACNPPYSNLDVDLLNWIKEKKFQYEKLAFDIEVNWKRMSRLNDELLMVRIDNEKSKSLLFIIFEGAEDKEIARGQLDLFYHLYKKFSGYINNDYCDISFLNYLEEVKLNFPNPFTYALVPEGERTTVEELLRVTLGRELNSKKLKQAYSLKKKLSSFPIFKLTIKEEELDKKLVERGYFFTDPSCYKEMKERESLYVK